MRTGIACKQTPVDECIAMGGCHGCTIGSAEKKDRVLVPLDEVIEMIDKVLDEHHFTEYGKLFVDLSEELKQKYEVNK